MSNGIISRILTLASFQLYLFSITKYIYGNDGDVTNGNITLLFFCLSVIFVSVELDFPNIFVVLILIITALLSCSRLFMGVDRKSAHGAVYITSCGFMIVAAILRVMI